jgi:hypothetical protein
MQTISVATVAGCVLVHGALITATRAFRFPSAATEPGRDQVHAHGHAHAALSYTGFDLPF